MWAPEVAQHSPTCGVSLPRLACATGWGRGRPEWGVDYWVDQPSVFPEQSSLSCFVRRHLSVTAGHFGAGGLPGEQTTL